MPYQPLDTPFLVQRFCIMCRAFFPDCELDIPGDGTVTATFGKLGYADMYPSVAPDRTQADPGDMLMLLHSGEVFKNDKMLWSGYDVEKFLEVLKQFNRDPEGTAKFYVRKTRRPHLPQSAGTKGVVKNRWRSTTKGWKNAMRQ